MFTIDNWLYTVLYEPQLKGPLKVLPSNPDRVFWYVLNYYLKLLVIAQHLVVVIGIGRGWEGE